MRPHYVVSVFRFALGESSLIYRLYYMAIHNKYKNLCSIGLSIRSLLDQADDR